jgi:hypothetical protein
MATAAAALIYFSLVLAFQAAAGAPSAPFGAYPDEPSHYLSGLMTHDYLLHGIGQRPTDFAYLYYAHDPYIGIGNWPPLYYVAEALWIFCFGTERFAVLWLVAITSASCATLIFSVLRKDQGILAAFSAGLLFLLAPVVEWSTTLVMTDLPVAALSFAAVLALARYLDSGKSRDSAMFAALAGLAMLTKASALFLAAIPPAAVALSGRWRLLKRLSFWLMPAIVAVVAGPWYLFARRFIAVGFTGYLKVSYLQSLAELSAGIWTNMGWLTLLSLAGLWSLLRERPIPSAPTGPTAPDCGFHRQPYQSGLFRCVG